MNHKRKHPRHSRICGLCKMGKRIGTRNRKAVNGHVVGSALRLRVRMRDDSAE